MDADQRICEEGINRFAHFTGKCIQNYSSEQIKAGQGSKVASLAISVWLKTAFEHFVMFLPSCVTLLHYYTAHTVSAVPEKVERYWFSSIKFGGQVS